MKKIEMKLLVSYVALLVVGVLAVGTIGVAAYTGANNGAVFESGAIQNNYYGGGNSEMGEGMIGASNAPIRYVYDYVNGFYVAGKQVYDSSGIQYVNANILPSTTNVYNLGSFDYRFNNIYASGTVYTSTSTYLQNSIELADGSTSTTIDKNTITMARTSSLGVGKFYVDSSGNVNASGTLKIVGASTLTGAVSLGSTLSVTGHFTPATDNLYDVGASSTQFRYGNFQQGLLVADGTNTSTLANTSLIVSQATSYNVGKFYVDSSGNAFASGTLAVVGATTMTAGLAVDTNSLLVDATNNKVGVVSTTPYGQMSIGAGGDVTSTISVGKFCMFAGQENGTNVYVILGANQAANQPFATTTVSCF